MTSRPARAAVPKQAPAVPLAAFGLLLAACCFAAEQPAKSAGEAGKSDTAVQPAVRDGDTPPKRTLDGLKLPPNSVIVLTDEMKDALKLVPRAFVLSPEEYQKLIDELQRLRAPAKADKPIAPTVCRLTGRVEGDVARIQAEFEFRTDARNARVALACEQGHPRAVALDGQLPVLHYTPDGFVLQVDEPGAHKATLDLDLAVTSRSPGGSQRGFVLDLPRASVTTLELDVPAAVKEVRVRPTTFVTKPHEDKRFSRLDAGALGPIDQLDVAWKGPASRSLGSPLLTADGLITVQVVAEGVVKTVADLKLEVLRGQVDQWRVQTPPQAVVRLKNPQAEDRVVTIEPKGTLHTIRFKEPSAEPLALVVELEQARGSGPVAVGPFHVVGAFRQRGTILIGAPPDLRLRYTPRSEVSPREPHEVVPRDGPPDFKPVAAFTYWNLPAPDKPQAPPPPLLSMEFQTVKGVVEVRAEHALTLTERGWHTLSNLIVRPPPRGEVKELTVELPPDFELDKRLLGDLVAELQPKPGGREVVITLAERQTREFTLPLEGNYPMPAAGEREVRLELPRMRSDQATDRGGKVTVTVPADMELLPPAPRGPARESVPRDGHNRYTLPFERLPERVEVAWRPYRPDLPVDAVVDVVISGNQASVRHRLWAPGSQALPAQLPLRVPEALTERFSVAERGQPVPGGRDGASRLIRLTDTVSKTRPLVLEYWFTVPAAGGPFAVPLVVPEQATRGDVRLRVWSDPGVRPAAENSAWQETPTETAEGHDRLPDLCLRGTRPDLPLTLRLSDSGAALQATVSVERALVRATVLQAGQHSYWASFRISQLRAPHLDIELPAAPAALGLKVLLNDVAVNWHAVGDAEAGADAARLARLSIGPALLARPAVLDVVYQIAPSQPAARSSGYALGNVALQTTLHAPQLRGSGDHVPVRWDVRLPARWVPLFTGGGFQFEQRWGWRGWLLAPQPAASGAELARWFAGDAADRPAPTSTEGAPADEGWPSVVCWRTDLEPLRLSHAPQQAWLLTCSLTVLAIGLGLYFLLVQRGLYWPVVVLLGVVTALVGLVWPSVLAVVFYGCQPGLAVLLLVFGAHGLLQRRYRRQVVFLPGFTRVKGGSSLIRGGTSNRGRAEPTTVDVGPALAGSSSQRRQGSDPGPSGEAGGQG